MKACARCKKDVIVYKRWTNKRKHDNLCSTCKGHIRSLKKFYNMTIDEYDEILQEQNGKCAICCTQKPDGQKARFCVDHDHETGRVRGLLCNKCNTLLGCAHDSIQILENAIFYIKQENLKIAKEGLQQHRARSQ